MIPLIIVSASEKKTDKYIQGLIGEHAVKAHNISHLYPQTKEFGISQIRELKKDIAYSFKDTQMFVLHDFDTASLEAQNAFLKTLEEHQPSLLFVMLVKSLNRLLPTITSRCKVVYVNKGSEVTTSSSYMQDIDRFVKKDDVQLLAKFTIDKNQEKFYQITDELVSFFRGRLGEDPVAASILDEIMITRQLVQSNNVNAQASLDHLFLFIKHLYQN